MLRNSFLPLSKNTERKRFLRTDGGIVVFEDGGYNSVFRLLSGSVPDIYTEWVHFARVQGGIVVITPAGQHLTFRLQLLVFAVMARILVYLR